MNEENTKEIIIDLVDRIWSDDTYSQYLLSKDDPAICKNDEIRLTGQRSKAVAGLSIYFPRKRKESYLTITGVKQDVPGDVWISFHNYRDFRDKLGLERSPQESKEVQLEGLADGCLVIVPAFSTRQQGDGEKVRVIEIHTGIFPKELIGDGSDANKTKIVNTVRAFMKFLKNKDILVGHGSKTSGKIMDSAGTDKHDEGTEDKRTKEIRELLESSHQVILTGAPGTGKTYLAKKVAEAMVLTEFEKGLPLKDKEKLVQNRIKFVQFHSSYDYSDFVEGLRPIQGTDGQVGFKRMDGVFKKMCKDAIAASRSGGIDNFDESWKKFVDDLTERNSQDSPLEIKTDSTMFKVFLNSRNNLSLITSGTDKVQGTLTKAKIRGYYIANHEQDYWACYYNGVLEYLTKKCDLKPYQQGREMGTDECPKFVFIIDEINRGDISKIFGELFFSIDPGYRGTKGLVKTQYQNLVEPDDVFAEGFYVPENVYIIGTMNDIDRSVESMDFAIRRRFVWHEVEAKSDVLKEEDARQKIPNAETRKDAESCMDALNGVIEKELGSEYAIGPAYFFKLPNLQNDFNKLWDMNLKPLLREYLRGNSKDEIAAKMEKFKKAYFESLSETQKRDDKLNAADQNGKDASGKSAG